MASEKRQWWTRTRYTSTTANTIKYCTESLWDVFIFELSRHEFSFQDTFFQIFFSRIFFLICQRLIKAITGVPFLQIARCHLVIGLSSVLWRLMMLYWSVRECGSMGHQRDLSVRIVCICRSVCVCLSFIVWMIWVVVVVAVVVVNWWLVFWFYSL